MAHVQTHFKKHMSTNHKIQFNTKIRRLKALNNYKMWKLQGKKKKEIPSGDVKPSETRKES